MTEQAKREMSSDYAHTKIYPVPTTSDAATYREASQEVLRRFDQAWRGEIQGYTVRNDKGSIFVDVSYRGKTSRLK